METVIKKKLSYRIIISVSWIFLSIPSHLSASQTAVSFDNLFPLTWYEKGMRSILFVWHELKGPSICTQLCIDICLSKLAFARCCVERIAKEGEQLLEEDRDYCRIVLDKVRTLISKQTIDSVQVSLNTPSNHKGIIDGDYLYCFYNLIQMIDAAIAHPSTITP